jgi:hypothetical protein
MMNVSMRSFIGAVSIMAAFPFFVSAATLSLDPAEGSYGPGETFIVTIRIDTDSTEECVNAVDATVRFPKEYLKPVSVSKGESLLSLWTEEPSFSLENGTVRISGGIPGGYCGRVVGDPGKTNVIAKIVFSVPATQIGGPVLTNDVPVSFSIDPESFVLLNDGNGIKRMVGHYPRGYFPPRKFSCRNYSRCEYIRGEVRSSFFYGRQAKRTVPF